MGPECLIIGGSKDALRALVPLLDSMHVHVEMCPDPQKALRRASRKKFEAVVVGCDDPKIAMETVRRLREMPSTNKAVVLAIVRGYASFRETLHAGATFVLEEPLPSEIAARTLRVAYGLIVGERRRYYRHPVSMEVQIGLGPNQELQAESVNLSEGGMAVQCAAPLETGRQVRLRFCLPGTPSPLETKGEIAWVEEGGRVGIRFVSLPASVLMPMKDWFLKQLEKSPKHEVAA